MSYCVDATSAPPYIYIVYTYTITIIIGVQYNNIYRTDSAAVAENRSRRGWGRGIINCAAIFLNLFCSATGARRLHAHHNNIHSVFPVVIYRIKTFLLTRDTSPTHPPPTHYDPTDVPSHRQPRRRTKDPVINGRLRSVI